MESTIFTAVRIFAWRITVNEIFLTRNTSQQANFFHINYLFQRKICSFFFNEKLYFKLPLMHCFQLTNSSLKQKFLLVPRLMMMQFKVVVVILFLLFQSLTLATCLCSIAFFSCTLTAFPSLVSLRNISYEVGMHHLGTMANDTDLCDKSVTG